MGRNEKSYKFDIVEDVITQRVKVSYTGYGSENDEFDKDDIVQLKPKLPYKNFIPYVT